MLVEENGILDQPTKTTFADPSSDDVVLSVRGVSKKFCRNLKRAMFYGLVDIGGEIAGTRKTSGTLRKQEFWAIDDVSFDLRKGEALGLVGANGAGKTTLLKMISGLIKPNKGEVRVKGRIAPLIALGAGFNPILSGRENISINMAILGLTSEQIKARFDEVVEFAEIGHAIDAPVQTYSSGMSARLGFSCAIHTDPDILLIDEVLAVGDINFRIKCYKRLNELKNNGASFLIVSHSSQSLLTVCKEGILLKKGQILMRDSIDRIVHFYENSFALESDASEHNYLTVSNSKPIAFREIFFSAGKRVKEFSAGAEGLSLNLLIESKREVDDGNLVILVKKLGIEGGDLLRLSYLDELKECFKLKIGENLIKINFPLLGLNAGFYIARISLCHGEFDIVDFVDDFRIKVNENQLGISSLGVYFQPRTWSIAMKVNGNND